MTQIVSKLIHDETAATMTEYAMVLALIAVAAVGVLQYLGNGVGGTYDAVSDGLSTATSP
jgi:Flp pilus assembly pilin Flp